MPALAELTESSQCATTSATKLFSPVVQARISGAIVERLRSAMREGRLRPGDRLPCERELCLRFGVSRVTLREALRILELAGLLEVRLGARGGAIVVAPSAAKVGEAVVDALTMSSLLADQLLEVCSAMELGMVDLVCERAEGEDLACLERICERAELALPRAGAARSYHLNSMPAWFGLATTGHWTCCSLP